MTEKDGNATFVIQASNLDSCYSGVLKAKVERTDKAITIELPPKVFGCEEVKFVIKADGTGGQRFDKIGENWVLDNTNRILTLRK